MEGLAGMLFHWWSHGH